MYMPNYFSLLKVLQVSFSPFSRTCKKATRFISSWQILCVSVDFKWFWRSCITVRITWFWDLVYHPVHWFSGIWMSFGPWMREQVEIDHVSETLGRVQKLSNHCCSSHVCMKQFSILRGTLLLRNERTGMTSANIWSQIVVEKEFVFYFISHVSYEKQVLGSVMMVLKHRNIWIKTRLFCY